MAYDLNEIKSKNNILDVARELGLEVHGTSARCFRPERHKHRDQSPSLSFDTKRNTFRCFVCRDVGGSVIDLVMQVKGLSFRKAVEYLANRAGMKPTEQKQNVVEIEHEVVVDEDKDRAAMQAALDSAILQKVYEVYEFLLESCGGLSREAAKYLHERGISEETAKKMRLAYISDYGGLCRCLAKKFPQGILGWTGLFNTNGRLKFYKHRLLFPFLMDGRVVYLQARALDGRTRPKELNLNRPFPCPFNVDKVKEEAVVELLEAAVPIPITLKLDALKVIRREGEEEEGGEDSLSSSLSREQAFCAASASLRRQACRRYSGSRSALPGGGCCCCCGGEDSECCCCCCCCFWLYPLSASVAARA